MPLSFGDYLGRCPSRQELHRWSRRLEAEDCAGPFFGSLSLEEGFLKDQCEFARIARQNLC